ncbi:AHH domain-containing protein [Simiduia sp. 21SJ11W-1]|uniref:AHH domain-containing protein n=1 Tax=Simiduia sp. 21SJ11W-1 TaxID=2909669 RepID=UPI0020A16078|nr:AHH domain-containing protein [Simiduia sp. 21SJ11W-1]UTA49311.1 AHH domain-containing protein [Simiduia sp. 21SJ11W-1]
MEFLSMEMEKDVPYALQTELDRAMSGYKKRLASNQKLKEDPERWLKFVQHERGRIQVIAQVQAGLAKYRQDAKDKDVDELEDEKHCSQRLGDHMRADGFARPGPYWHAHAIVAGCDTRAWQLRALLAECSVGIDDADNGCWLPSRTKYTGQQPYPKAVPHSRIHRHNYFAWLNIRFAGVFDERVVRNRLSDTRRDLLHATFPKEVMLPKGQWNDPYDNLPTT